MRGLFRFAGIGITAAKRGITMTLLTAILTMVEATVPEINDSRHKLGSEPVVQAHKRIVLR
jgi:hypothetical protein